MPPAVAERDNDRAALRKKRIIDAARRLFAKRGFHATGVAAIAKEADIAVQQLYRDFPSKAAIIVSVVSSDCAALLREDHIVSAIARRDEAAASEWFRWIITILQPDSESLFLDSVVEARRNADVGSIVDEFWQKLIGYASSALTVLELTDEPGLYHNPINEDRLAIVFGNLVLGMQYV